MKQHGIWTLSGYKSLACLVTRVAVTCLLWHAVTWVSSFTVDNGVCRVAVVFPGGVSQPAVRATDGGRKLGSVGSLGRMFPHLQRGSRSQWARLWRPKVSDSMSLVTHCPWASAVHCVHPATHFLHPPLRHPCDSARALSDCTMTTLCYPCLQALLQHKCLSYWPLTRATDPRVVLVCPLPSLLCATHKTGGTHTLSSFSGPSFWNSLSPSLRSVPPSEAFTSDHNIFFFQEISCIISSADFSMIHP